MSSLIFELVFCFAFHTDDIPDVVDVVIVKPGHSYITQLCTCIRLDCNKVQTKCYI